MIGGLPSIAVPEPAGRAYVPQHWGFRRGLIGAIALSMAMWVAILAALLDLT